MQLNLNIHSLNSKIMNEIGIVWWILGFFILLAWGKICSIIIDQQSELKMITKPPKR